MVRPLLRDILLALALAGVMGIGWSVAAWGDLARLRLPDTDDTMRLVEVRDWLAGQAWRDLSQHRVLDLPMHWTRPADLGPAALIWALSSVLGRHGAEVAAVVVWPLVLFAAALLLIQRIARALGPDIAPVAAIVAALAFPATTLFLPGRIDHHGLQMVLLLGAVAAELRAPSLARGLVAGLLAAASLVIGLELLPFFAVLAGRRVALWAWRGEGCAALAGWGLGALGGLAAGWAAFSPAAFGYSACDGFTASAVRAAAVMALVPLALAAMPPVGRGARVVAAGAIGAIVTAVALALSPACLSPYGAVDPRLAAAWLAKVGEAQPLWRAPPATGIGYVGIVVAGLAATAWRWRVSRAGGWAVMTLLVAASLALSLVQLRGAYAGAMLAAPGLAAMIGRARMRGPAALAGAWVVSAGIAWPAAAGLLPHAPPPASDDCLRPAIEARLAALPPGTVLAPIDAGPRLLLVTPHRIWAAPYHRNAAGNLRALAAYRGGGVAGADYALTCTGSDLVLPDARRIATQDGASLWIVKGLSRAPARR